MKRLALTLVCLAATAEAGPPKAASTQLTLARGKAKPARLLAKKVEVDGLRPLTPCVLKLEIESQHTLFKHFSIVVTYEATSSGAIKNGRGPISAEIKVAGEASLIATKRGFVDITRRKSGFDAKLETTFDHGSSPWTLSGTVRIDDAACLWDIE